MTQEELNKVLDNHKHWLNKDCDGWESMRADLRYADLRHAVLIDADLRHAVLIDADLRYADLRYADLRYADLRYADLSDADLSDADLHHADLRYADLSDAILHHADLRNAKNIPFVPIACPSDGEFIGWKKVRGYLIKLRIPEDAKRCSATTEKCRCDKAFVLGIYNLDGTDFELTEITNCDYKPITYKVGEMVCPDSFDDNRWNECSHGIHFFINKENAIRY